MPEMPGIEATRHIVKEDPEMCILVITIFDDDSVFVAMRAGARLSGEGSRRRGDAAGNPGRGDYPRPGSWFRKRLKSPYFAPILTLY